ncbi:MAG: ribonuclease HII, partial [Actinomycetota bacterium]|nr:ribonuclease HII [Actinomycetota bacterium]
MVQKLRKAIQGNAPTLLYEKSLWAQGKEIVVGIDEVGKGAWAGPLTVGAAVIPKDKRLYKVRDSKLLKA